METNRCHFPHLALEGRNKEQTRGQVFITFKASPATSSNSGDSETARSAQMRSAWDGVWNQEPPAKERNSTLTPGQEVIAHPEWGWSYRWYVLTSNHLMMS